MIATYFLEVDYGTKLGRAFVETEPGRTESDVIDQIAMGNTPGKFRNIYRVELGKPTEQVTEEVAKKLLSLGGNIPPEALDWLDWVGFDIAEAAE